jgi:TonB-linked SusC/RagA family outer membrane protein
MKLKLKGFLALMLVLLAQLAFAQERTVTGTVTDVTGMPLPGVSVVIKGNKSGSQTGFDGTYTIKAAASDVLVFSFIGMKTQERTASSNTVFVKLMENTQQLNEVVVVTGSAKGKKIKEMTYAIGQVGSEILSKVPATDALTALQGKISGLKVNSSSGEPGSDVSILLRSANSLSTGQKPLVILDGAILEGGMADVNTQDIDRIEVVKGAAGASLYGSRAAAGVIQIFSKRGKNLNGKTRVTFRSETGFNQITKKLDLATKHFFKVNGNDFDYGTEGQRVIEADGIADNPYPSNYNVYDYQNQIFKAGEFLSNHLAIEGGKENTSFLLSYDNQKSGGILVKSNPYVRNNFRVNLDHNVTQKFKIGTSMFYSSSRRDPSISGTISSALFSTYLMEPIFDWNAPNKNGTPYLYNTATKFNDNIRNPLYTLENNKRKEERNRFIGSFNANYDVNSWFKAIAEYSIDYENSDFSDFLDKGYLSDDPDGRAKLKGYFAKATFTGKSENFRVEGLFTKSIGKLNSNLKLGFLDENYINNLGRSEGYGLAVSGIQSLDNLLQGVQQTYSRKEEIRTNSYYGVLDADYFKRILISVSFRREGSSLFGTNSRWNNYYRVSGALRLITNQSNIRFIDEFKIRGAFGTAGIRPLYGFKDETYVLRNGSYSQGNEGNDNLKPAVAKETEIGINATFLKRFDIEINYITTNTTDQILLVPLSGITGFSDKWKNAGEIEAKSYEASLGINIINNDNWKWDFNILWDKTSQKIKVLDVPGYFTGPGTQETKIFKIKEGENFGGMYGNKFVTALSDLPASANQADYIINSRGYVVNKTTSSAQIYKDATGNSNFKIGDVTPDFNMSFSTTLKYKNFDLYALVYWKKGGDIYNKTKQWLYRENRSADIQNENLSYNFYQSLYNSSQPSAAFVEDGSFVRLKEMSLYYTLNSKSLGKVSNYIDELKFGLVGRNLLTSTKYSGADPEISHPAENSKTDLTSRITLGSGSDPTTPGGDPNVFKIDNFSYPTLKSFSISIQVKL